VRSQAVDAHSKDRTCYLAYPNGIDISPVLQSLADLGLIVVDATSLEPGSRPLAESIQAQISDADIMIAVLSGSNQDRAVLFELGLARGLGKPTILFAPPRATLPSELTGVPIIRLDWRNKSGLNLAVRRAMDLPPRRASLKDLSLPSRPLGAAVDGYLARLQLIRNSPGQGSKAVASLVAEAFTAGGAVVEVGPRYGEDDRPDLVMWHNELESTLGNPLVVEIKHKATDALGAARQLGRYMAATGTTWGLLLFVDGYTSRTTGRKALPRGVLAFAIDDLLVELRDSSLPKVITQARNRIMHGLD
jgi:nucleoside 2-deoxyribosyltransferase-like protein